LFRGGIQVKFPIIPIKQLTNPLKNLARIKLGSKSQDTIYSYHDSQMGIAFDSSRLCVFFFRCLISFSSNFEKKTVRNTLFSFQTHAKSKVIFLILLSSFLILNSFPSVSQSNKICKTIAFSTQQFRLDSASLDVATLKILNVKPSFPNWEKAIKFDYSLTDNLINFWLDSAELNLSDSSINFRFPDSIRVCYRVFPIDFSESYSKRNINKYYEERGKPIDGNSKKGNLKPVQEEDLFALKGIGTDEEIEKTGSLTRGVTFGSGNAQDVSVTSALNLQLQGKLTKDLELTATISDQNIPFQPEGNTQQIQDFDQILIELRHKYGLLSAGDVVFENDSSSYFLKYYKNVQGAQLQVNYDSEDSTKRFSDWEISSKIGISAAKGQFNSDTIASIEGVQGPYRLRGGNGERFIVILAGSEKVYLDGKLLKRGYDFDYTIDYNTAEVTFTNRIVVTRFSRIRVDFEYATQDYSRSILQTAQSFRYKKFETTFQFYREQDNKNAPLLANLSDSDRFILSTSGDDLLLAVANSANEIEQFDPNQVLYTQKDTLVAGVNYTILVRATSEVNPLFSVVFSEVGFSNGDYVLGNPTANGREYVWIAPIGGIAQGSFAPVRQLPAPNKRQLLTWSNRLQISKNEEIFTEVGVSNQDVNLFSESGNNDNSGAAFKIGYSNKSGKVKLFPKYKLESFVTVEQVANTFRPIDRFRAVDFDRDWAIESDSLATDRIAQAGFRLQNKLPNKGQEYFSYQLAYRNRTKQAEGFQQRASLLQNFKKLRIASDFFWLNSERDSTQANWTRFLGDLSWQGKNFVPGYQFSTDKNTIVSNQTKAVLRTLMNFEQHQTYLQSSDSLLENRGLRFRTDFALRTDFLPQQGELKEFTKAQTLNFNLEKTDEIQNLNVLLTYRQLENVLDSGNSKFEETVMGRVDWRRSFLDNNFKQDLSWATASGRELRREFFFLPVDVGLGTHTWRDDNGDGEQDLNEFYLAINLEERTFAKFFRPTDEYVLAFSTTLNYRLGWKTPNSWRKEKGVKKLLYKFSGNVALLVSRKTTDSSPANRLLPFLGNVTESDLLSSQISWLNTVFFNRKNPKFGAEWKWRISENRQLLTSGFQENRIASQTVNFRRNWSKKLSSQLELEQSQKALSSDVLDNQNYLVETFSIAPEFTYQPKKSLRFSVSYSLKNKDNLLQNSSENAQLHEFALKTRLSKQIKSVILASIRYIRIDFEGNANSPVGYEMLEALSIGENWRWELNWSQRLANGLQIGLTYNGRKPPELPAIHIGSVQATALF
jgi:hypothetical protein